MEIVKSGLKSEIYRFDTELLAFRLFMPFYRLLLKRRSDEAFVLTFILRFHFDFYLLDIETTRLSSFCAIPFILPAKQWPWPHQVRLFRPTLW